MSETQAKRRRSYKREVGMLLIISGLTTLIWFLGLSTYADAEMVKAYASAIPMIIVGLIGAGIAPFGIHHIWDNGDSR